MMLSITDGSVVLFWAMVVGAFPAAILTNDQ